MALIDKEIIRAEIERLKSKYRHNGLWTSSFQSDLAMAKIESMNELLSFLDSLPEQPVEWEDEYREEDLRTRFAFYTYKNEEDDGVLYLSNVFVEEASRNAGFGTKILEAAEKVAETIGAITICLKVKQDSPANAWYRKHGYGYVAFEGEYDWLEKNLEYLKPKRKEQPVEGLEEEVKRYYSENFAYISSDQPTLSILTNIARHFAEWGAEWQKKRDDLETADLLAIAHLQGMEQQKAKMLEDAVEHFVIGEIDSHPVGPVIVHYDENLNIGDKVRVIVIKDDEK